MAQQDTDFAKLKNQWYRRLKKVGFCDIEDHQERLKSHDHRTTSFERMDETKEFFEHLDEYLNACPSIPRHYHKILLLFSQGIYLKDICKKVKYSLSTCKRVIRKYKTGKMDPFRGKFVK